MRIIYLIYLVMLVLPLNGQTILAEDIQGFWASKGIVRFFQANTFAAQDKGDLGATFMDIELDSINNIAYIPRLNYVEIQKENCISYYLNRSKPDTFSCTFNRNKALLKERHFKRLKVNKNTINPSGIWGLDTIIYEGFTWDLLNTSNAVKNHKLEFTLKNSDEGILKVYYDDKISRNVTFTISTYRGFSIINTPDIGANLKCARLHLDNDQIVISEIIMQDGDKILKQITKYSKIR